MRNYYLIALALCMVLAIQTGHAQWFHALALTATAVYLYPLLHKFDKKNQR
jgi:hypothetical protein